MMEDGFTKNKMGLGYRVCRVCATVFSNHTIKHAASCELRHFGIDVEDLEALKLDVWVAHMARDTLRCPETMEDIKCPMECAALNDRSWKQIKKDFCMPCWARFAEENK